MKDKVYLICIFICGAFFSSNNFLFANSNEFLKSDTNLHENADKEIEKSQLDQQEQDEQLLLDDEKLLEDICNILSISYKEVIDLSALYFCGLIDSERLYSQIISLVHKDFFKIIKLFSWYMPSVLKNSKISNFVKIKKSLYVTSVIIIFWCISKETFQGKGVYRGIKIDENDALFNPRQRPSINL